MMTVHLADSGIAVNERDETARREAAATDRRRSSGREGDVRSMKEDVCDGGASWVEGIRRATRVAFLSLTPPHLTRTSFTSLYFLSTTPTCPPTSPLSSESASSRRVRSLTAASTWCSDGLKQDGTPDKRVSSEHGLGADRERASELGKQGGAKSGSVESAGNEDSGEYTPSGGEDTATGETYK